MEMIKGANVLTYKGHIVYPYDYYQVYHKGDYVELDGRLFKSKVDLNKKHIPMIGNPFYWEMIGKIGYGYKTTDNSDKKSTTIKVNNDRTGDITADNVVIYGNHTGDISAQGEKAVVVIFGNVTGNVKTNQVIYVKDDKKRTN